MNVNNKIIRVWNMFKISCISCVYPYTLQPNVRASISEFISYAHTSVNEVSYCSTLWVITTPYIFL